MTAPGECVSHDGKGRRLGDSTFAVLYTQYITMTVLLKVHPFLSIMFLLTNSKAAGGHAEIMGIWPVKRRARGGFDCSLWRHLSSSVCTYLCVLPHAQARAADMSHYMIHPVLPSK